MMRLYGGKRLEVEVCTHALIVTRRVALRLASPRRQWAERDQTNRSFSTVIGHVEDVPPEAAHAG
jgi:hypothetical protein